MWVRLQAPPLSAASARVSPNVVSPGSGRRRGVWHHKRGVSFALFDHRRVGVSSVGRRRRFATRPPITRRSVTGEAAAASDEVSPSMLLVVLVLQAHPAPGSPPPEIEVRRQRAAGHPRRAGAAGGASACPHRAATVRARQVLPCWLSRDCPLTSAVVERGRRHAGRSRSRPFSVGGTLASEARLLAREVAGPTPVTRSSTSATTTTWPRTDDRPVRG